MLVANTSGTSKLTNGTSDGLAERSRYTHQEEVEPAVYSVKTSQTKGGGFSFSVKEENLYRSSDTSRL